MHLPRHTLVAFAPAARAALAGAVADRLLAPFRSAALREQVATCFAAHDIPGIACRPTEPLSADQIQLGIAFPFREGGARVRALIAVEPDAVRGHRSPYDVLAGPIPAGFPFAGPLEELTAAAGEHGVRLGAFGSAALHLATGLDYVEPESDLDLVVKVVRPDGLAGFVAAAGRVSRRHSVRLDIEVDLVNGYGVKAKELCSTSRTVLGRSLADVRLLGRDEALQAIVSHSLPVQPTATEPTQLQARRDLWN